MQKSTKCKLCGYFPNRPLAIDAVIIREGNVLLIKRGSEPLKGWWALPGGHVEWDESAEQTCIREVQEETGLVVLHMTLVGVYSKPQRDPNQVISITYLATTSGEPIAGDDAAEVRWYPLENLPQNVAFDHRDIINDAASVYNLASENKL